MIDAASATIIGACALIFFQVSGVLIWSGMLAADVKRLKEDVRPVTSLSGKLAALEERIDSLLDRLGNENLIVAPRRARQRGQPHDPSAHR